MFHQIGLPEILIILGIVVLLFGAKKLPELARGSGEALRIFKSEVKGDDEPKPEALESRATPASPASPEPVEKKTEQQG
ncbi:MAG TPA: twin-arginine translocase TatA/TatE family subunit [Aeromicrobium sp.]|nr:twin-arginine translocase TatA/TatE family subunit [Aeromicrobium sp.]